MPRGAPTAEKCWHACDERETALRQFAAPQSTQPGPCFGDYALDNTEAKTTTEPISPVGPGTMSQVSLAIRLDLEEAKKALRSGDWQRFSVGDQLS
jgi:hypothetical protein